VTLLSSSKNAKDKTVQTTTTANVTHNNARLLFHSDGHTYEFVGLDGSGNRIYRDTKKAR
jgi:hypothetical protein